MLKNVLSILWKAVQTVSIVVPLFKGTISVWARSSAGDEAKVKMNLESKK